ncbi:MAG: argininosuccinate synthase [Candidatus Theseobacter exili]|nr:argininosuccinate synthase [Candidatus Theseobacter exili]
MAEKVVLAYSGGLDTSIILKWLKEEKGFDVIAFVADLGQGEDMEACRQKAIDTGASKVYVEDLSEIFVKDYVFPIMRANARYEDLYFLGTSIARPLIAKRQIEIAEKEGACWVSHGATGKGNDQVRFELTYYALKPDIKVIAPWREWSFNSRESLIDYAKKHDIPIPVSKAKPYSSDGNLLHISYEGGILEDPWAAAPDDIFQITVSPEKAPDKPEVIEIEFESGDPVAVNGNKMTPACLLNNLNKIAGAHGIGRVDIVENRFVGMKSRGVYETPGGTVLHVAHRALETLALDKEVMYLKDRIMPEYARLVYNGFWFSPEMELLNGMIHKSQKNVTGTVKLKLYKGLCSVLGRKSPNSLYKTDLATFEEDMVYDQRDAEGFIKLNALRLTVR